VELIICNYLARFLLMENPAKTSENEKTAAKKLKKINAAGSQNELNEQFSKSLLVNVLDMNDDFIGNKYNPYASRSQLHMVNNRSVSAFRNNNNLHASTTLANQNQDQLYSYSPYSGRSSNMKRENSGLGPTNYEMVTSSTNDASFLGSLSKTEIGSLKRSLGSILKEIRQITQKIKDDEEDESKELNWKFAAMVIDRLCLLIFTICTLTSTISILMTSKNFFMPSDPDPKF
jgi:hypothetical protein